MSSLPQQINTLYMFSTTPWYSESEPPWLLKKKRKKSLKALIISFYISSEYKYQYIIHDLHMEDEKDPEGFFVCSVIHTFLLFFC